MKNIELEEIRKEIDEVDTKLAQLFEKRMNIVSKVIKYKRENNIPVKDDAREEKILNKSEERIENKKYVSAFRKFMRSLMDITCVEEEIELKNLKK